MDVNIKYLKDESENIISPVTSTESIYNSDNISLSNIMKNNAGFHNSIYRGEDITDLFYNGTLTTEIANGTFNHIFIGDYIIGQSSNRCYLVGGINYRYLCGEPECVTQHILMLPSGNFDSTSMNSEATTAGAYVGSEMYTTYLEPVKAEILEDFGEEHILTHYNYFSNTVTSNYESAGSYYESIVDLMNEQMVFGTKVYNNWQSGTNLADNCTIDTAQLPLFALRPDYIAARGSYIDDISSTERHRYWLRDVANSTCFCTVTGPYTSYLYQAAGGSGIRPAFLVY